ncbi:MAG: LPS export ABC transporter periplasmic protein LptC [Gemmatimonadaceae bacterium]
MKRASLSLLVALLASAAACQQTTQAPPVVKNAAIPDSADQLMFGVWFVLTDAGVKRAEVRGDTAYLYEESTRSDLRQVKTEFFKLTGAKDATLTSLQGTYSSRLGTMEARGNVVVISTDGRKLVTPHLRYDPARNEISSDSAFVLTQTDRRLEGIGFVSDPDLNNIKVLKNMKAFGQEVTIPKR